MKKAFFWIAPAVGIMFVLFCRMTFPFFFKNESGGIGRISLIHLGGLIMPIAAYFITDLVKNKTVARSLYGALFVGMLYAFYWHRLIKYAFISN